MKNLSLIKWYVLRLYPKKERLAMSNLDELGFSYYFPLVRHFKVSDKKKEEVFVPLFTGYLFVKEDAVLADTKLQFIKGSCGLLHIAGKKALVTDAEIELLKRVCNLKTPPEVVSEMVVGERITIKSGSLKGIAGVVNQISGKHYIYIDSGINGMQIKLNLKQNIVEQAQRNL